MMAKDQQLPQSSWNPLKVPVSGIFLQQASDEEHIQQYDPEQNQKVLKSCQ